MASDRIERKVTVHDPELSARANRALTAEVREALGTDTVWLPRQAAEETDPRPRHAPLMLTALWRARMVIGTTLMVLLVLGGIASLITGSWWFLLLALGLHALATLLVTVFVVHTLTNVEKPAPEVVAALEAEGVRDPEQAVNDAVRAYADPGGEARTARTIRMGSNERTARPFDDPARATVEQQTAMTPSSEEVDPAPAEGPSGARPRLEPSPVWWPVALYGWLLALTIIIPLVWGGGPLWFVPVVAGPMILVACGYHAKMFTSRRAD